MLFTSGVFPSTLKIAKVVPVHKKDSKLDFSNYQPISSLLSNLDNILEKILHTESLNYLTIITFSTLYNLVLDKIFYNTCFN